MFFLVPSVRVISESRIKYEHPTAFRNLIRGYADEQLDHKQVYSVTSTLGMVGLFRQAAGRWWGLQGWFWRLGPVDLP